MTIRFCPFTILSYFFSFVNNFERSKAKIFLYKDMSGEDIYLFLDSVNDDEFYYPRSFVVAPELDYKVGQYKYTVLWKEKRHIKNGENEVLSRFKEFNPSDMLFKKKD